MQGSLNAFFDPTQPMDLPLGSKKGGGDEVDLVERARHDRQAFGALYQRFYPIVATYVYRRTGDRVATEEIVSDVFFSVLTKLHRFRWRRTPFHHWLLRIATHAIARQARSAGRRERLHARSAEKRGELEADEERLSPAAVSLQTVLLSLPVHFQEVLVLHHVEGLDLRAIATIVGCRVGTVKSRLARGRAALRERLGEGQMRGDSMEADPR